MKFYDRYLSGEDSRSIYNDIYCLGATAFQDQYFEDIHSVLTETFLRVAFNLEIIYAELKKINYCFKENFEANYQKPLLSPLSDTEQLLTRLEEAVADFGQIPLSLKLFYSIVGSCNFVWDYDTKPVMLWQYADPIQISSLDDLVNYISEDDWRKYMNEIIADDPSQHPHIELAADYLHKDNISGGPPYSIQITKDRSIDSLFLNEPNNTTFIDYLRICMENCGFSRIAKPESNNDYQSFFDLVKPQLRSI